MPDSRLIFPASDPHQKLTPRLYIQTPLAMVLISILCGSLGALLIHAQFDVAPGWLGSVIAGIVIATLTAIWRAPPPWLTRALSPSLHITALGVTDHEHTKLINSLLEATPNLIGVVELREDGLAPLFDNPAACRAFGSLPIHLKGGAVEESAINTELNALWLKQCREAAIRHAPVRFDFQTGIGLAKRWYSVCLSPLDSEPDSFKRFGYIADDITELKRNEATLLEAQERLSAALDTGALATWDWDIQNDLVHADARMLELFGMTNEPTRPLSLARFLDHIHPEDRDNVRAVIHSTLENGHIYSIEYRVIHADQSVRWVSAKARTYRNEYGKPTHLPGVAIDITHLKEVEQALQLATTSSRQQLDELESIYKLAPIGLAVLDVDLKWTRINTIMADFAGNAAEDLIGHPIKDTFPTLFAQLQPLLRQVLETKQPILRQIITGESPKEPGIERYWNSSFYPLLNIIGEAIGINCVSEDITDRKRAEEQARLDQERLALALEAGNLGFWDWNIPSGHVQFGGCWSSMLGYDSSEIAPHVSSWEKLIHPDDRAEINRVLDKHLRGETQIYECEHRLKRKDGLWMWVLDRGRVVTRDQNGAPIRAVGIHADIVEQHEIREALKIQARRKDEFLATLAHELRNPLAPLRTGLSIIKRDPSAPAANLAREMMERQLSHMVRLIDDLLDVSRVTRGALELRAEETDLQTTIIAAIEASKPAIDAAKHTLITNLPSEPIRAQIDSARISQVVSNLLINAAKYTPDGGKITLNLSADDSQAKITVEDTGIGIPTDMFEAIFEMFGQVSSAINRSHGGLGIGLALAKKIIEMHRGTIKAYSAGEGTGSVFTVTLPCLPTVFKQIRSELPMESESNQNEPKPRRAKVLVVDDNVDGATSLKMYLEMLGHDVSVAYDGETALAAARSSMPDLVFLDIGLPGINGYEVAKRLREIPCQSPPLIAAVTGWGSDGDKRSSAEAGCDAHLTKPIDLADAESLIKRQLDIQQHSRPPQ